DVMPMPAVSEHAGASAAARPAPDEAAVRAAATLLAKASRRVIIAGGGAVDCGREVVAVADALDAAIVVTTAAKGLVAEDHPRHLGATLALPETQAFIASADIALAVGTELAETDWWLDAPTLPRQLVRIDIDAAALVRDRVPDVAILGDAGESLKALGRALNSMAPT